MSGHRGVLEPGEIHARASSPHLSYGPNTPPPASGDWIIDRSGNNVNNTTVVLNGWLNVTSGDLTLDNVTLVMNCTSDGQYGINVSAGGTFNVTNSNITAFNGSLHYKFAVYGAMTMDRCDVSEMWGNSTTYWEGCGITIFSDGTLIRSSRIFKGEAAGILVHGGAPSIIGNVIAQNDDAGLIAANSSAPSISDCLVTGNAFGGLLVDGMARPEIMNCTFSDDDSRNEMYCEIMTQGNSTPSFHNCTALNNSVGIWTDGTSRPVFIDCTVKNNNLTGIVAANESAPAFANCSSMENGWAGMQTIESSSANVSNCTFSDNQYHGIRVSDQSCIVTVDCIAANNNWSGIMVGSNSTPVFDNCTSVNNLACGIVTCENSNAVISNCYISNNYENGIQVQDGARPNITGCDCVDNNWSGIIAGFSSAPTISNCTCTGNGNGGGYVDHDSASVFRNCTLRDNNYGMTIGQNGCPLIMNCQFINNTGYGVSMGDFTAPVFVNSTFGNNSDSGMEIIGRAHPKISDCAFQNNGRCGIIAGSDSSPALTGCILMNNSARGMQIGGYAIPTVEDCTFVGNSWCGVGIFNDSAPVMANCTFKYNDRCGASVEGYSRPAFSRCIFTNNKLDGVSVTGGSSTVLTDSVSSYNNGNGVAVMDWSSPRLDGLEIHDNGGQNIWVASTVPAVLSNSTLTGGVAWDILLSDRARLTIVNTTYSKKAFVSSMAQLKVQWYVSLSIFDRAHGVVSGATTGWTGMNGSRGGPVLASVDGTIKQISVTEYIQNNTDSPPEFTYYSPYDFIVTKDGETNLTANVWVAGSISLNLFFDYAPAILLLSDVAVREDEPYHLNLTPFLSDRDNPLDIVGLGVDRENVTVDNATHTLTFLYPRPRDMDTVTVTASDGLKTSSRTFGVAITPVNDPPECVVPIPGQTVCEDQTLVLDLAGFFLDEERGTDLSFGCNMENITIDDAQKKAIWTPGEGNGSLAGVVITASDGFLTANSNPFDIEYIAVNEPPVCRVGLKNAEVREHKNWSIDLDDYFTDEEDPLGMHYESSHAEVLINQFTRHAIWIPGGNDTYGIEVFFTAHDAQNYSLTAASEAITLTYLPVDDPPRFVGKIQDVKIKYGDEWNITLEDYFKDDDSPSLRFFSSNPAVKIFEAEKNRHYALWKPYKSDSNLTGVVFTAYDGTGKAYSTPVNLNFDKPAEGGGEVPPLTRIIQSIPWYIYALIPIAAIGGIAGYYTYRRVKYGHYEIEQLFLINNDGRLLAHRQKKDTPQVSNDILTGMLTALKGFIQESLQDQNKGQLDQMQYGDLKIALEHGRTVYLAAFISGYVTDKLKADMKEVVGKVEAGYEPILRSWDGMMASVEGAGAFLDGLMGSRGPKSGQR